MSQDGLVLAAVTSAVGDAASIEVTGSGPLADLLRRELTVGPSPAEAPEAVVETTGTPEGIREALTRVADLGVVVVAGPLPDGPVSLDLYSDLHVRGLSLVGVRPEG